MRAEDKTGKDASHDKRHDMHGITVDPSKIHPRPGSPFDLPRQGPAADAARLAIMRGWLLVGPEVPLPERWPLIREWADHCHWRRIPTVEAVRRSSRGAFVRWYPPILQPLTPEAVGRIVAAGEPFTDPGAWMASGSGGRFLLRSPDLADEAGAAVFAALKEECKPMPPWVRPDMIRTEEASGV